MIDRRGHVTNVVPLRPPANVNPLHPSVRQYDQDEEPVQLSLWQRQLVASTVRRWEAGAPVSKAEADRVVGVLLGDTP